MSEFLIISVIVLIILLPACFFARVLSIYLFVALCVAAFLSSITGVVLNSSYAFSILFPTVFLIVLTVFKLSRFFVNKTARCKKINAVVLYYDYDKCMCIISDGINEYYFMSLDDYKIGVAICIPNVHCFKLTF